MTAPTRKRDRLGLCGGCLRHGQYCACRGGQPEPLPRGWWRSAACARPDVDADLFTANDHDDPVRTVLAQIICAHCPVAAECLADGYALRDDVTIRGGTTGAARRPYLDGVRDDSPPTRAERNDEIRRMRASGLTAGEIRRQLRVDPAVINRALGLLGEAS